MPSRALGERQRGRFGLSNNEAWRIRPGLRRYPTSLNPEARRAPAQGAMHLEWEEYCG